MGLYGKWGEGIMSINLESVSRALDSQPLTSLDMWLSTQLD